MKEKIKTFFIEREDFCRRSLGFMLAMTTVFSIEASGLWPSDVILRACRCIEIPLLMVAFQEIVRPYISITNYLQDKLIDMAYDRLFGENEVKDGTK